MNVFFPLLIAFENYFLGLKLLAFFSNPKDPPAVFQDLGRFTLPSHTS